jgi:hypothetical protein
VSLISEVSETIESANSGYVHAASVHVMDIFDGRRFVVPVPQGQRPVDALERMVPGYLFRAMVATVFGAMALGLAGVAQALHAAAAAVPDVPN